MERLLRDAEKLEGLEVGSLDVSNFADIVDAIHIVQENLGIAGTTAKEASTTISGSLATMQSAWQNTLAAIGEGDMSKISTMIDNLVESATTFAGNVMPVVQRALEGISQLITELAPEIAAALPDMITKVLPSLLDAGVQIIQSLGEGILNAIPELLPTITEVILQLAQMLVENLPQLIEVGLQVILQLALGIAEALPELIPAVVDTVLTIAEYLIDNVDLLIDAAIALIIGLAEGLIEALPKLIEKAPEIVTKLGDAIIRNAPKILGAAISLILTLIEGIVKCWGKVFEIGAQIIEKIKGGFTSKSAESQKWGRDLIDNFINGIKEKWEHLKQTVKNVAQSVKDYLGFSEPEKGPLSNFHTYAPDMMDLFAKGIRDNENVVTDQIAKSFDFGNITGNVNVSGTATGVSGGFDTVLQRIEALLAQYLPQVQKDIVLDTGALVGGTVAAYDAAFGTRSNRGGLR
jgi:phage-related protein